MFPTRKCPFIVFISDGDKPWKCPTCGEAFSQKSNLKRHVYVRHEKPGKCAEDDELFEHVKREHSTRTIRECSFEYGSSISGASSASLRHDSL